MPAPALRFRGVTWLTLAVGAGLLPACNGCRAETSIVAQDPDTDTGEVAPFTNNWGQWLSMDVMADGSPAVAYYDKTRGALGFAIATVADDGTATWDHEEADGYVNDQGLDVGDRGKYASMAVADDGRVWVASYDIDNGALRYAVRDTEGVWTTGLADAGSGAKPDAGQFASLALDGSGDPVVAHYDAYGATLRVARGDAATAAFTTEVVDEGDDVPGDTGTEAVDADVGSYAALAIADGTEYIAYYDAAAGDLKLAVGSAGSWSIEVVDSEGDVGQWPDLLVDGGTVTIAYHDITNQDLKVATGSPGSWTIETVDDGEYVGADTELFMNGSTLAVLYFDGHDNDMKHAWKAGAAWSTETITGDGAALGFHNEVVESGGKYYAACYDYTDGIVWFAALN